MSNLEPNHAQRLVGLGGCLVAVLVSPPIGERLFALVPLHRLDHRPLWILTGSLLLVSSWVFFGPRTKTVLRVAALLVAACLLIGTELAARVCVLGLASPDTRRDLALQSERTYADRLAYRGHPFVQFTGRPANEVLGTAALHSSHPFNARGFHGPDVPIAKPPDTVRIVCLGASTTADGYPEVMNETLNSWETGGVTFETVSLGLSSYTSNHSVVNFILNGLDYAPDYVVFHHAWNDGNAGSNGADFAGDYSNVYKVFDPPTIPDALLIRGSVIYRWLTRNDEPSWVSLHEAIHLEKDLDKGFAGRRLRRTLLRNLRTVVDVAVQRGIRPVIVTLPLTSDPEALFSEGHDWVEDCNAAVRKAAAGWGDEVILVDLDAEMSGRHNERFIDLAHLDQEGIRMKAERVARAIYEDWEARRD